MRAALFAIAIAACGPPNGGDCEQDSECSGDDVCARSSECLPPSAVHSVRITWTVRGQPANGATCAQTPDLYLMFFGFDPSDTFGYEPVPCDAGLFFIDKLPTRFGSVELGDTGGRFQQEKVFDSQGNASFDLAP